MVSRRCVRLLRTIAVIVTLSGSALASKERPHLPCEYSGTVSRKYPNTALALRSDAMKQRATKKVDISGPAKQADIRGTVIVEVLVGPDGNVVCAKGVYGHPMLLSAVEDAVRLWKFKPITQNKAPIAYVGQIDFTLCNIGCGPQETSMTLLK